MSNEQLERRKFADTGYFFKHLNQDAANFDWDGSQLKDFLRALETVHQNEKHRIEKMYADAEKNPDDPYSDYVDDAAIDIMYAGSLLRPKMQACLAVAVVSHVESCLIILIPLLGGVIPKSGIEGKLSSLKNGLQVDKFNDYRGFGQLQIARTLCDSFKHRDAIANAKTIEILDEHADGHSIKVDELINFEVFDFQAIIAGATDFCKVLYDAVVDYRDANPATP